MVHLLIIIITIIIATSSFNARAEQRIEITNQVINDLREFTFKIKRNASRVIHPKTKEDELWAFAVQQMYSKCEAMDEMAPLLISKDHDSSSLEFNFECEPWEFKSKRPSMAAATCKDLNSNSTIKSACEIERKSKRKYSISSVSKPNRTPAIHRRIR